MQIYTMAFDIKVPAEGPVQILEVMAGHRAGSTGYDRLQFGDIDTNHILPHLEEISSSGHAAKCDISSEPYEIGLSYGYNLAAAGHGIIYPRRHAYRDNYYYELSRSDLQMPARFPEFDIVNADQTFLALTHNKAPIELLIAENPQLKPYFVRTFLGLSQYHEELSVSVKERLGSGHEKFVIKPVDQAQGNGVRIIQSSHLNVMLQRYLGEARKMLPPKAGRDFWETDISPLFMVQPYVESVPVKSKYDLKEYDGTLRVFMTLWRENDSADFQVKVHDGYWKLPQISLDKKDDVNARVSATKGRLEQQTFWHRLKNRFKAVANPWSVGVKGMKIDDDLRARVFPEIEKVAPILMASMVEKPLHDRITEWWNSDDPVQQAVALMVALDPVNYVGNEADPLPLNAQDLPESYVDKAKALHQAGYKPITEYVDQMSRQNRPAPYGYKQAMREHLKPIENSDYIKCGSLKHSTLTMMSILRNLHHI